MANSAADRADLRHGGLDVVVVARFNLDSLSLCELPGMTREE